MYFFLISVSGIFGYIPRNGISGMYGSSIFSLLRAHHTVFTVVTSLYGEGSGTHSSALAWRIPGTGEPGGLQSMG